MSNTVQAQHPAVVLRSNYLHLRTLLAIAVIAILGLTVAVVVLAVNSDTGATASSGVKPPAQRLGNTSPQLGSNSSYFYPGHY